MLNLEAIPNSMISAIDESEISQRETFCDDQLLTARIAIVDDIEINIKVARALLQAEGYENFYAVSEPEQAIATILEVKPDILLLDIMMPNVSGLDILQELRQNEEFARLPVVVLTGSECKELKADALKFGATDFLHKPIDSGELVARVRNCLRMKAYEDHLRQQVERRTAELQQSQFELINCLARAVDFREDNSGSHSLRVAKMVGIIADELGYDEKTVLTLCQAATLHDVGKIGLPDSVLLKKGDLTDEEDEIFRQHCGLGRSVLTPRIRRGFESFPSGFSMRANFLNVGDSRLIQVARNIALTHHEWWDGTGYPLGLSKENIPIEGRITALADAFDGLSNRKSPNSESNSMDRCFEILEEKNGVQFDPDVVSAFMNRIDDVVHVKIELGDE